MAIGSASAWATCIPAPDKVPTVKAYSVAGWVYAAAVSTGSYANFMEIVTAEGNNIGSLYLTWHHVGGLHGRAMFVSDGLPSNPTYHSVNLAPPANTWTHLAAVFTGSQLLGYKNGALVGSAVTVSLVNLPSVLKSRALRPGTGPAGYGADLGYWNAALTADEIAAMGKGVSAGSIRNASRFAFCPFIREQQNIHAPLTGGAGNTATTHPRIYSP